MKISKDREESDNTTKYVQIPRGVRDLSAIYRIPHPAPAEYPFQVHVEIYQNWLYAGLQVVLSTPTENEWNMATCSNMDESFRH